MKLAVPRRFTPPRLAGRTRLAALGLAGVVVLLSAIAVGLYFFSIWPFSSDEIHRGSITDLGPNSVTYQTEDGVRIVASWFVPRDAKSPPVVVLLHEQDGTRAQWDPLVPVLVNAGYAVLAPDLRGFGGSTTIVRDGQEEPYQFANRPDALLDVEAALKWLKSQREVDSGRVGVIGYSWRLGLLVVNVAVVIYLVRRKRLFRFDEAAEDA